MPLGCFPEAVGATLAVAPTASEGTERTRSCASVGTAGRGAPTYMDGMDDMDDMDRATARVAPTASGKLPRAQSAPALVPRLELPVRFFFMSTGNCALLLYVQNRVGKG